MNRGTRLTAVAAFALAAPISAGVFYIPAAIDDTTNGMHRSTDLWVTNTDLSQNRGFFAYFIAAGSDGTQRPAGDPPRFWVGPGGSLRIGNLIPPNAHGMVEIDSTPSLVFNAELSTTDGNGTPLASSLMPLLTDKNALAAGDTAWLLALEKSPTVITNIGVVNLSDTLMHCTDEVRRVDGLLIVQNMQFNVPPRSSVYATDALTLLQLAAASPGARAGITCDQSYWAFSTRFDQQTGGVELHVPGTIAADSTLQKPTPGGGPPPTPGAIVFSVPGQFVQTTLDNPTYHCIMDLGSLTALSRVIVDVDFTIGSWDPDHMSGYHNVIWLNNGVAWQDLIAYIGSMGTRGQMNFQVNSGIDQEHRNNIGLQLNTPYHLHSEFDTTAVDPSGAFYEVKLNGQFYGADGFNTSVPGEIDGSTFYIAFGTQGCPTCFESNTPDWTFSNFNIQFVTIDPVAPGPPRTPVCCSGPGFGC